MKMDLIGSAAAVAVAMMTAGAATASPYDTTVEAAGPLAYYDFDNSTATTTTSAVNDYVLNLVNGATVQAGRGPTINGAAVPALVLANGQGGTAYATSPSSAAGGLNGGISNAGTILAWINLASLPSTAGRTFSIAGESAYGDDVDLQIDGDNRLRFYTDGGSATTAPVAFSGSDIGNWAFIAATFTAGTDRSIYLNGTLAGSSTPGGHYDSGAPFYIGQSNVFGGRFFDGGIADVAVYNQDLSAAQIAAIYASASAPAAVGSVPEPASWAMMVGGLGFTGAAMRRRRAAAALTA